MFAYLDINNQQKLVNGKAFGYHHDQLKVEGELVFSTNMVGYPESISDPSFREQILVLTYPMVGSYGVPSPDQLESIRPQIAGLVVQELIDDPSHWNSYLSLNQWLKDHKIPGIQGVDTRALTKFIRESGTLPCRMLFRSGVLNDDDIKLGAVQMKMPQMNNLVDQVSIKHQKLVVESPSPSSSSSDQCHLMVIDCGLKKSQLDCLFRAGAGRLTVVRWDYDFLNDLDLSSYDGFLVSNGPGDPGHQDLVPLVDRLRELMAKEAMKPTPRPIMGICLGHQLMGIAVGLKTFKMKYGNRGINIPVQFTGTQRALITSQNHGYALDLSNLGEDWRELFVNPHDGSNEGLIHRSLPFFSVQFHPEGGPGPTDSEFLFTSLVNNWVDQLREFLKPEPNLTKIHTKGKKVLVLGSGGLSIGQSGEFDYSGSQAIKAYREEGLSTILVNPNVATIQTSRDLADKTYSLPVQVDYVIKVIVTERPDYITVSFGGQTALNCGVQLYRQGILEKYGVEILGSPIESVIKTEDREIFKEHLESIGERCIESQIANNYQEAMEISEQMGFPLLIRAGYVLGGLGSGFVRNQSELEAQIRSALSFSDQVIIDKSLEGWKELEYEVVRDQYDNCLCICNMENIDPLGVHTGESMVVAPSQTLDNIDYQMLRTSAIRTIRSLGVVGECNIQFALSPDSREYYVIEVNARLSRSSALASKATGYPLAYVASKLSLGYSLLEVNNSITGQTTACFEPSMDYCVIKVPRWDLRKFPEVDTTLDSSMKSIGEAMAISRRFEEAYQKALRMADDQCLGLMSDYCLVEDVDRDLARPNYQRSQYLGNSLIKGMSLEKIYQLTKIDRWFLRKFANIIQVEKSIRESSKKINLEMELFARAKLLGFSDKQIAKYAESTEIAIRKYRREEFALMPVVKQIDTVAGEFPCETNYLYTTYSGSEHDVEFGDHTTIVLGSGVYKIGSSVEFDWCCVNAIRELRRRKIHTTVINCNPETVSTDYDEGDKLYFEELSFETVMDIYQQENAKGIILSMGGQIPNNISMPLYRQYVNVVGTSPETIDIAENRYKFSRLLDQIGVKQPRWQELDSLERAVEFCQSVGYPCLIRPSYVLSGVAMNVCHTQDELKEYLGYASEISPEHPVVISKYITDAKEVEVDAVASQGEVRVISIAEHVENAGVHSGDSTIVLPAQDLTDLTMMRIKETVNKMVKAMEIKGPLNLQFMVKDDQVQVIECNLRVSRTFPFVSKTLNLNLISVAIDAMLDLNQMEIPERLTTDRVGVKVPKFSFSRLRGADFTLGVEMVSTGEVACYGNDLESAYIKGIQASDFRLPKPGSKIMISLGTFKFKKEFLASARTLKQLGYQLCATRGTCDYFLENQVEIRELDQGQYLEQIGEIELVINVSRNLQNHSDRKTLGYLIRRTAIDNSIPLIVDIKWAKLFVRSLEKFDLGQRQIWVDTSVDCLTRHNIVRLPGMIDLSGSNQTDDAPGRGVTMAFGEERLKNLYCDYGLFDDSKGLTSQSETTITKKIFLLHDYLYSHNEMERDIREWTDREIPICVHADSADKLASFLYLANLYSQPIHVCSIEDNDQMELIKLSKKRGVRVTCDVFPFLRGIWEDLEWIDCFRLEAGLGPLLMAVKEGKLTIERLVKMCHTNPKKIFGLPSQEDTYVEVDLDQCRVCRTVLRGKIIFMDGQILTEEGTGKIVEKSSKIEKPSIREKSVSLKISRDQQLLRPEQTLANNLSLPNKLMSVGQLNREVLGEIFRRADQLRSDRRAGKDLGSILKGKIVGMVFYEPSSRTKSSFVSAVNRLGGKIVDLNVRTSSVKKGESFSDTMRTMECYTDCLVLRSNQEQSGELNQVLNQLKNPVINAGDGMNEHPTQAILDIYTIRRERGTLNGLTICLMGDLTYGRTAHSLVKLLVKYQNVRLKYVPVGGLEMPESVTRMVNLPQSTHQSLDQIIEDIDVLYCTRIQKERHQDKTKCPEYQITAKTLNRAKENLVVLHPLPRTTEISPEVDDDPRAGYFRQMKNGVYVRMALLEMLLA